MKYNRLTLVERVGTSRWRQSIWHCICDCGNEVDVIISSLRSGNTKSCGCYHRERASQAVIKHGHNINYDKTLTYKSWINMKARCTNSKHSEYNTYGGKGITVCDRWLHSFENFLEDMGERPTQDYCIDRIDSSKGYYKENCQWITQLENSTKAGCMKKTKRN